MGELPVMYRGPEIENMIYARAVSNIPKEIKALPYFFPQFNDSNSATQYLEQHEQGSGCFLLRLSSKGDNYLSVSVSIANHSVRHVNVQIERGPPLKYYIVNELKFSSFRELRQHYTEHRICNLEQIENVRLTYPLENPLCSAIESNKIPQTPVSPSTGLPASATKRKDSASRPLPSPPSDGVDRPPCPPPVLGASDLYYSHVRDVNKNRIAELHETLITTETKQKCDCGILIADSELPNGWSLHKSHDSATFGCLFYQSAQGDTTWNLPMEIVPHVTERQKGIIVNLSRQSGKPPPKALKLSIQEEEGGGGPDRGGGGGVGRGGGGEGGRGGVGGGEGGRGGVGGGGVGGGGRVVGGGTSPDVVPQMPSMQAQSNRRPYGQHLGSTKNRTRQDPNRL